MEQLVVKNFNKIEIVVFIVLVLIGAWLRVALQHIPNFAPIAAAALFAGYFFRRWTMAACVPLLTMAISDTFIGGYHLGLMAIVYGMLALPVAGGWVLRRFFVLSGRTTQSTALSILGLLGCTVVASVTFFVVTNFGHWLFCNMYPHTAAGLLECYIRAILFFRYTLVGDILFGFTLFGMHTLLSTTLVTQRRMAT